MFTKVTEDAEKDLFIREWYTTGTATPPPLKSYRKKKSIIRCLSEYISSHNPCCPCLWQVGAQYPDSELPEEMSKKPIPDHVHAVVTLPYGLILPFFLRPGVPHIA